MGDAEIERLVVRLLGDGSSFQNMMRQAETSSRQIASVVSDTTRQIEGIGNSLKGFAATVVSALGAFGVATSLKGAFGAFSDHERAMIRLQAAVESNGGSVQEVTREYIKYAESIAAVTTVSKQSVLNMLTQAQMMGITGDKAKELIQTSISLAAKNQGSAESFLRIAKYIQSGHIEIARRVLGLGDVKNKTELLAQVQNRLAAGWNVELAMGQLATTQLERLGRSLKSITIEMGGLVARGLAPFMRVAENAVSWFKSLSQETQTLTSYVVAGALAWAALPFALRTVYGLLGLLKIAQIGNIIMWAAWGFTVVAAKLVFAGLSFIVGTTISLFWFLNGTLGATVGFLLSAKGAAALYAIGLIACKFLTIAWALALSAVDLALLGASAAKAIFTASGLALTLELMYEAFWMGVLNVLATTLIGILTFGVGAVIAFVAAGAAIAIMAYAAAYALAYLGGAVVAAFVGAYTAITTVGAGIASSVSAWRGNLSAVTAILDGWGDRIHTLGRSLMVDFSLAWQFVVQYARLAWSQIKDLWPPLWSFMQAGAAGVWRIASAQFMLTFTEVFDAAVEYLKDILVKGVSLALYTVLIKFNPLLNMLPGFSAMMDALKTQSEATAVANKEIWKQEIKEGLKDIDNAFANLRVTESPQSKAIKSNIAGMMTMLEASEKAAEERRKRRKSPFGDMAAQATAAEHAVHKLDAALVGSAEARRRLEDWEKLIASGFKPEAGTGAGANPHPEAISASSGGVMGLLDKMVTSLGNIDSKIASGPAGMLSPANLIP